MTAVKRLFLDRWGHHGLLIQEEEKGGKEVIVFILGLCFDYDTDEWDIFKVTISKDDFIEEAKRFLEMVSCETDKLQIEVGNGNIHIFAGESKYDIFKSHSDFIKWTISDSFSIKEFKETLKEIIEQGEKREAE